MKDNSGVNVIVWTIWIIGFLFTMGFVPFPKDFDTYSLIGKAIYLLLEFFLWPAILGYGLK